MWLPPVAPPGTDGEYLTVQPLPQDASGFAGSIGLGFRVPMLVISPFSRGGHVCHETFDHTSQLRFLEERFGVRAPNLSAWRRSTVGDLTATLQSKPGALGLPALPPTTNDPSYVASKGCTQGDCSRSPPTSRPTRFRPSSRCRPKSRRGSPPPDRAEPSRAGQTGGSRRAEEGPCGGPCVTAARVGTEPPSSRRSVRAESAQSEGA